MARKPPARKPAAKAPTPWLEWAMAGLGLVLLLAALAVILVDALSGPRGPAEIAVRQLEVTRAGALWRVEVEAANAGGRTAAGVELTGQLAVPGAAPETASATLDYLPAGGRRRAALAFRHDPRQGELQLHAAGWTEP